jgi:hypothetical protein
MFRLCFFPCLCVTFLFITPHMFWNLRSLVYTPLSCAPLRCSPHTSRVQFVHPLVVNNSFVSDSELTAECRYFGF